MGGLLNRYTSRKYSFQPTFHEQNVYVHHVGEVVPRVPDRALHNQTFNIQGQTYTLLRRLGGGAFGSVWSASSPNGK